MSVANSVEERVPFVDLSLLKSVNSIPGEVKTPRGTTKPLLKNIEERYRSDLDVYRGKVGLRFHLISGIEILKG